MKLKSLMVENLNMEVNEKIKEIKSDSEKNNRRFFKNEISIALNQIKGRTKKGNETFSEK